MKLFSNIYQAIVRFLYRNVYAMDDLRMSVQSFEQSVQDLKKSVEQLTSSTQSAESTITNQQRVLADLRGNTNYLVASEQAHLKRAGQPHEF
jgi:uncharacterized protein YoxC